MSRFAIIIKTWQYRGFISLNWVVDVDVNPFRCGPNRKHHCMYYLYSKRRFHSSNNCKTMNGGGGGGRPPSLSTLEGNESPVSMIAGPYLLSGGPNSAHPSHGSPVYRQGLLLDVLFSPLHGKLPLKNQQQQQQQQQQQKNTDTFCLKCHDFLWHNLV